MKVQNEEHALKNVIESTKNKIFNHEKEVLGLS